jgi:hypothetical protein
MSYAYFRHPAQGPGFGSAPDPFTSISQNRELGQDDDEGYVLFSLQPASVLLTQIASTSTILMMALEID